MAEVATIIEILRKRTTRNVPLALLYLSFPLFFLLGTDGYRTLSIQIGQNYVVPVQAFVTLPLALCFIYAASVKLFVRTSDKVLLLLMEEIFKGDSEARVLTMSNKAKTSHATR